MERRRLLPGTDMQSEFHTTTDAQDLQYDDANDRYVLQYDLDGPATISTTIVHAIATVADVDVSQGEFSLYDSIDPDALERIFAPIVDGTPRTGGHVAFTALDHQVTVNANGTVHIHPPE